MVPGDCLSWSTPDEGSAIVGRRHVDAVPILSKLVLLMLIESVLLALMV
jgi:hypothetical protein